MENRSTEENISSFAIVFETQIFVLMLCTCYLQIKFKSITIYAINYKSHPIQSQLQLPGTRSRNCSQ